MILLQELNAQNADSAFQLFEKLSPKFFTRLAVDFISILVLIRFVYFPLYRNREYVFTFFIFNIIIFLITYLLNKVDLSMGAAFGLFAVFSILRYRTENISAKDMTYLFLSIAMGLLTAVTKGNWDEIILVNMIIIGLTWVLESRTFMKKETSKIVMYEKIELIKPEHKAELLSDLENRLGVKINQVSVGNIDFLRDTAELHVYYYE